MSEPKAVVIACPACHGAGMHARDLANGNMVFAGIAGNEKRSSSLFYTPCETCDGLCVVEISYDPTKLRSYGEGTVKHSE